MFKILHTSLPFLLCSLMLLGSTGCSIESGKPSSALEPASNTVQPNQQDEQDSADIKNHDPEESNQKDPDASDPQSEDAAISIQAVSAYEKVEETTYDAGKTLKGLPVLNLDAEKKRVAEELYNSGSADLLQIDAWWQPQDFQTLSVYQNSRIQNPNPIWMEQQLKNTLALLGLPADTEIRWNTTSKEQEQTIRDKLASNESLSADDVYQFSMTADAKEIRISINPQGTLEILFASPKQAGGNLSGTKDTGYARELIPFLENLLNKKNLDVWQGIGSLGMTLSSDTSHLQYPIYVYEKQADPGENLVSATLQPMQITGSENGDLYMIRLYQKDLGQKAGDYPILSVQEATEALNHGDYVSGCRIRYEDAKKAGGEIAGERLVYRGFSEMDYDLIPWYQFIVEVPQLQNGDLKTYAAYYVPAIQKDWIE